MPVDGKPLTSCTGGNFPEYRHSIDLHVEGIIGRRQSCSSNACWVDIYAMHPYVLFDMGRVGRQSEIKQPSLR